MRCKDNLYRPTLEILERRDLPSTTAVLSGGALYVTSTTPHEFLTISQSGGRISVSHTPISIGNHRYSSVSASAVNSVVVYTYGGGDVINLRPSAATALDKPAFVSAGGGYNQVFGGLGPDYLVGGTGGHNTLTGGPQTDHLAAGSATDVLNSGGGFDYFYRPINPAAPFIGGEHVSDVRQGFSPSCQADAALAEAVQQGVNFAHDIRYLGHSTYSVSLYGGAIHENVVFDGWYTSDDPVPAVSGEFWTILMYRARLEYFGINPTWNYTDAQWDTLNAQSHYRLFSNPDALWAYTGRPASFAPINYITPEGLRGALAWGTFVTASTPNGGGVSADGIIRDHAYAVMQVYYQYGMWKVQLYNPWGFDSVGGRTIESLAGGTPTNRGFITISWSQFVNPANFQGINQAMASSAQIAYFRTLSGSRE
jgi:Ca2+-binding RTX toxin-like protein